uniref:HORMA domain-containing protein n=1 Tax=Haemonchus contortus TaxID=6289 RepID=A0A7I4Y946_HAECO
LLCKLMSASRTTARRIQNLGPTLDNRSWGATFPEDVDTWSDSKKFISRCMYVAFCHIIASRGLLPSNNFKKRQIDGDLRAYVMNSHEVLGARFVQKFKGVSEAIDKKYLRELMLVISPREDDENDAIEIHCWRLRYDADGDPLAELRQADGTVMAALRFKGMHCLKKQVAELLQTIRTLCKGTLGALPPEASATLRITYTDRTPKGYQAPGFYRAPDDPVLRSDAQEIEIGAMQTKYHGASVVVQSVFIDDAYAVGLRLKDGVQYGHLNDSLNDSFGEDAEAGDEPNFSDNNNNNTIERISDIAEQQVTNVEHPRDGSVLRSHNSASHTSSQTLESDISKIAKISIEGDRGSPASNLSTDITSADDMPVRRTRHVRGNRVLRGQTNNGKQKSPVLVSESPNIPLSTTPKRIGKDENTYDTPPAKRTPGNMNLSGVTPRIPPKRHGR